MGVARRLMGAGLTLCTVAAMATESMPLVEVTGSRIRRIDAETALPVLVLSRQDMDRVGAGTLLELFQRLPNVGSGLTDIGGDGTFAPGATGAGLHGYGSEQVVVLLNGRRVAPYPLANYAEIFTNIDSLPFDAIERVEVLRSGASALYGSEAMAGVINVITKPSFQGWAGKVTHQRSQSSGKFTSHGANLSAGWQGAGDGPQGFVSLDAYQRDAVNWREVLHRVNPALTAPFPSFGTHSSFSFPGNRIGVGPLPGCPASQMRNGLCLYDRYERFMAMPSAKRLNLFASLQWGDTFAELLVGNTQTRYLTPFMPYGPALGSTTWANPSNNEILNFYYRGLPPGHPLNPTGGELELRYRFADEPADNWVEATQYRALAGQHGQWQGWRWEAAAGVMGGQARTHQRHRFSRSGFHEVIGNDDPSQTDPQFFNRAYRLGEVNRPEVLDKLFPEFGDRGRTTQTFADFRADGELARWEGRPIQMVWGAEVRHERFRVTPSANLRQGDIVGVGLSASDASRTLQAAYAELSVPFSKALELQPAARIDHYPGLKARISPKMGARWALSKQWVLRASTEAGFRAPNLSESAPSTKFGFDVALADPRRCPQAQALATDLRRQLDALPANDPQRTLLAARADIVEQSECLAAAASIVRDNPGLLPETSRSTNLGLAWAPAAGWLVTADAWLIERRNEIGLPSTRELLANEAAQAAGTIVRRGFNADTTFTAAERAKYGVQAGPLEAVVGRFTNLDRSKRSGIDLSLRGNLPSAWGQWQLGGDATYMLGFYNFNSQLGHYGANLARRSYPRWSAGLHFGLRRPQWHATLSGNYMSPTSMSSEDYDTAYNAEGCQARGWSAAQCRISSRRSLDALVAWTPDRAWSLSLSVRNLLAQRPPVNLRGLAEGGGGIIPQDVSDVQGRMVRLTLAWRGL